MFCLINKPIIKAFHKEYSKPTLFHLHILLNLRGNVKGWGEPRSRNGGGEGTRQGQCTRHNCTSIQCPGFQGGTRRRAGDSTGAFKGTAQACHSLRFSPTSWPVGLGFLCPVLGHWALGTQWPEVFPGPPRRAASSHKRGGEVADGLEKHGQATGSVPLPHKEATVAATHLQATPSRWAWKDVPRSHPLRGEITAVAARLCPMPMQACRRLLHSGQGAGVRAACVFLQWEPGNRGSRQGCRSVGWSCRHWDLLGHKPYTVGSQLPRGRMPLWSASLPGFQPLTAGLSKAHGSWTASTQA